MSNISTKINLAALKNAAIIKSGKNKDVDCILIPINQNNLFKSEKGAVYLDLIGFEVAPEKRKADSKDTHLVKQSLPKAIQEAQSDEEKRAMPILGNHIYWSWASSASNEVAAPSVSSEDDLPF